MLKGERAFWSQFGPKISNKKNVFKNENVAVLNRRISRLLNTIIFGDDRFLYSKRLGPVVDMDTGLPQANSCPHAVMGTELLGLTRVHVVYYSME